MGFQWLEYPLTGGKAQFDDLAAPLWMLRGWEPTEPDVSSDEHLLYDPGVEPTPPMPPEPERDLLHDPGVPFEQPQPDQSSPDGAPVDQPAITEES